MPTPVGVSELAGRTHGVMQVMSNIQAGWNLVAAIAELKRDYGEVVTVNEGDRSRPDQWYMRTEYLAGRGALAAYCVLGPHPYEYILGEWTSTHDAIHYGNAADLGGPGGAVISENARQLLDGNHPRGVIGRKYGLYNTGWFFVRREIWHFNIYPNRAAVLAPDPSATPTPAPMPEEDDMMQIELIRKEGDPRVFAWCPGTPLWQHIGTVYLKRIEKKFPGIEVQVVDGGTFLMWQNMAAGLRAGIGEAVWAKQFSDRRTAGQWFTAMSNKVTSILNLTKKA